MAGFASHVRRHQASYMIFGLGAMVFSLFAFPVSNAIYGLARGERSSETYGSFIRSDGKQVDFSMSEWDSYRRITNSGLIEQLNNYQGFYQTEKDQRAWEHKIWMEEARLAGIQIPDAVVREQLAGIFRNLTKDQYIAVLARSGFNSPAQFENILRDVLTVQEIKRLEMMGDVVTSQDIFEQFKRDNELVKLSYVAFPFAQYSATQAPEQVTDDELKTYYAAMDPLEKRKDFYTTDQFGVEAMYVDFTTADIAQFKDVLEGAAEPTEDEIKRQFEANQARYQVPDTTASEPKKEGEQKEGEPKVEGEKKEGEGAKTDQPPVAKLRAATLEEAKPQVIKELRLKQVLEKAATDYRAAKAEVEKQAAPPSPDPTNGGPGDQPGEKKGGPRAQDGQTPTGGAQGSPATPPTGDAQQQPPPPPAQPPQPSLTPAQIAEQLMAKFQEIAKRYHLEYKNWDGMKTREEIEKLDIIGDASYGYFISALKANDITPSRVPLEQQKYGYIVRMREREEAKEKPIAEVREKLVQSYLRSKRKEAADKDAKDFREALVAKAKEAAAAEIQPIEAEANKLADERIQRDGVQEEDKKKAIRDEELKKVESRITAAIEKHLHEHFDTVAAARSVKPETIDYFRKSFYSSRLGRKVESGARKYLTSPASRMIDAEKDQVSQVLTDPSVVYVCPTCKLEKFVEGDCPKDDKVKLERQDRGSCYVAMVLDRKPPEAKDMSPADREEAESSVWRMRQMSYRIPNPGRKDPLAWMKLQRQFQIKETAKEKKANEAPTG